MAVVVRILSADDAPAVSSLWQGATDRRRHELGLQTISNLNLALARPGVFGVAAVEGAELLSMATAMPARADDARSDLNVPGLAHISSVATSPDAWGRGLAGHCVAAVMSQATRRGYARVQLWTHETNVRSRPLYDRLGFTLSGRRQVDDDGEEIVHYLRELPTVPQVSRAAARLVCLDPEDRILLLNWRDPFDGWQLWEPPGGGIEAGETPFDAVLREWREETGLPAPNMARESTSVGRDMIFNGTRSVVAENFFLGRTDHPGVPRTEGATQEERDAYLGHAWVPWRELADLDDPVEPDLLPILRRLDPAGPWST